MTTPETEPPGMVERRIRRGCLPIIFLLLLVGVFNFLQYGMTIVVMLAAVLLIAAIAAYVALARVRIT